MTKSDETKKTAKSRTTKTQTAKKSSSAAKKSTAVKKKTTTKTPARTTASAGWREKKAGIKQREREPKTIAERKAWQEMGPIRRFLAANNGFLDLAAVPVFAFAMLCLYSLASGNDRPAAIWCAQFSKKYFGGISYLMYFWAGAFFIRFWLRNFKRFNPVNYRFWLYFPGLILLLGMILQYDANKHIPPIPPEEAGGAIANLIVTMVTNVLGNSGMLILLIFLVLFFIWQAWKFLAAREREQGSKEPEVPVKVYWENVRTAADAEEMEAEQKKSVPLTSDIEADFRSTVGLLTSKEPEEKKEPINIRREAEGGLRKLRETFREIAQPIPDKESMVPQGSEDEEVSEPKRGISAEKKNTQDKPVRRPSIGRSRKPVPAQLPLTPAVQEEPEEELPPEPVFEQSEDPNGSGLLSAPAEKPAPKPKEEPQSAVQVRSRKVSLDEAEEKVTSVPIDYSFVPTIPKEDRPGSGKEEAPEDPWILPDPAKILDPVKQYKGTSPDDPAIKAQAEKIERLLDTFGAPSTVVDIQCGPTFSQFGVEPGFVERGGRKTRVRIKQIEMLQKDLEMELSVKQLAIEAPIPGKTYVGIQVQNKSRTPVSLREVIESNDFRGKKRELGIALGKDINGATFGADLTRMPHLLIAGATGSGKSVCLNAILACLLLHNSPERLKLVLVDPKRVELTGYNGIPHLITPVVTDIEQVGNVLQWVLREMDMRNLHFMENGVRNIQEYNRKFPGKQLPYIVVVIDELANLMMEAASDIENSIVRLAQTARAMGIHLIVATQRPSRDVITGTIKGNLPTRIAFAVASYVDSQVILDRPGAENLFGKGDMYFLSTEETSLKRLQCVYVSDDEIRRIVNYWQTKPRTDTVPDDPDLVNVPQPVTEKVHRPPEISNGTLTQLPLFNEPAPPLKKDGDVLYDEAVKMVQRAGRASANMLVSRLSIGYSRANKLLARMEEEGIIGPPNANPAIPREILDYGEYGPENDGESD